MTWRIVPAQTAFPTHSTEWNRLNTALYGNHPFFDSRFIVPLLEYFGNGSELLCIHRSGATVDGALIIYPLGLGRWALFLPAQTQAGSLMLADAALLDTLLPQLPGYAWSLDLLSIDPDYAPDWIALKLPQVITPHALTMAVTLDGDFDRYWNNRPKKLVANIRRYRRRAEETAGGITTTFIEGHTGMQAALARYGQLETAGWKGKAGTAIASDNPQGHFYGKVLEHFARTGQALVAELWAGDELVASRLFIRNQMMRIALKTTYDESMAAFAPGRLLLQEVIQDAFAKTSPGSIEFYTNVNRDQAEWASLLRPVPHHQLFRNDLIAGLFSLLKSVRASRLSSPEDKASFKPATLQSYRSINELPTDALKLLEASEVGIPENAPGWFANLETTVYAQDSGVRYYVAHLAGRLRAILPTRRVHHGPVRRIEALSNYYTSLYAPTLAPGATALDLIPLLEAASREHDGAHEMRFSPMDPGAPEYAITLAALRSCGWLPFRYFCFGNWYLKVDQDWETYLGQREGQLRSTLKRKGKKFAAAGGALEILTEATDLEPAIEAFNLVYSRSWKKPEPYPAFIPGLIHWLAVKGWLRLGIARLGGKPIAAEIWIVTNDKANIFKLAHDEEYAMYAPGTLLTAHLMKHVIDTDCVREIDYLIGDDPYKQSWMNQRRERWGIVAYNPKTLLGFARLILEVGSRWLGSMVKRKSPGK